MLVVTQVFSLFKQTNQPQQALIKHFIFFIVEQCELTMGYGYHAYSLQQSSRRQNDKWPREFP
jgi:hypothetical protein